MKIGETKVHSFKRLATNRTNYILKNLQLLGNLSNTNNYSYTTVEVSKIFNAIDDELRITKNRFVTNLKKGRKLEL